MKTKAPTLTPLRLAILGLVGMHPQSGYDLKKIFETTPMGNFSSSPGAIYPALKSLEEKGWVRSQTDNPESLRPRLVYELTDRGDAVLRSELERTVTREDLIWHFDSVMLRFAFIERIGLDRALGFLEEFRTESTAYVEHLEDLHHSVREHLSPCGRLALDHGIQGYRGHASWAARAIAELSSIRNNEEASP